MDRAKLIFGHLAGAEQQIEMRTTVSKHAENEDDVVVVSALRTPICRARRGLFKVCFYVVFQLSLCCIP